MEKPSGLQGWRRFQPEMQSPKHPSYQGSRPEGYKGSLPRSTMGRKERCCIVDVGRLLNENQIQPEGIYDILQEEAFDRLAIVCRP